MNFQGLKSISQNLIKKAFQAQSVHFYLLLGATLLLTSVGLIMVLSASTIDSIISRGDAFAIFIRQFEAAIVGLIGLVSISLFSVQTLRRLAPFATAAILAIQLLVIATPLGVEVNGNKNWLNLGFTEIQPSELLKLALILAIAGFVVTKDIESNPPQPFLKGFALICLVSLGLVAGGKDIGTIIIFLGFLIGMLLTLDLPVFVMRWTLTGIGALGLIVWATDPSNNRFSRFGNWISWIFGGELDPQTNWQFLHGTWALAEGGLFGVGFGKSRLKWNWVPEAENDFIFAIIAEEGGLIGAITLVIVILALGLFMRRVWLRSHDPFMQLASAGIVFWLMFQSFVNISVVLGNLPVLGVPLPFVSSGGSSLIASLCAIGVLLAFERENHALEGSPQASIHDFRDSLRLRR